MKEKMEQRVSGWEFENWAERGTKMTNVLFDKSMKMNLIWP